ncbi:MAG: DNA-directed RNA polymerase subunit omega [Thermoguttaceae bacterium]|nr:DNA-directed RNA polymerase subunit omega [Thermoguttaceae bacterium]
MIDELRDMNLKAKVGGAFKLTTLIQKRLVALNKGAQPLVDIPGASNLEIAVAEIKEGKIYLSMKDELRTVEEDDMRDMLDRDMVDFATM